ncbi:DNA-binding PucR family transcriptional regulator [Nocardioides albertanoniae]|uniref:DNA-binding PucR family transcriptional regulator n=1 Tax=Nocardioides albertanoniae TaxID=1175486 RepID=A0A543ABK2_9ACTN|nr:helix-turn-helix domain-containing protein [Nocardioides albertanoniae]TQL69856.1 DNA-binding PucR family transcriptional regulator [Nocardioides albertanoniae]
MSVDLVAFLELLAGDAAEADFEGPAAAARAAGASAEEQERIEHAKRLALQVRGTLEGRRRREGELGALFESANDLAMLTNLEAVLQAIVTRARQLLNSDVAYLTLNDERRGEYMRVTEGILTVAFRTTRIPYGIGLGGLVAQTTRPYSTADYIPDERFRHAPDIDAAVSGEGIRAIIGVPLLLGSQAIGVLFAANRTVRPFGVEASALLVSLAAHAAIAVDKARLLEETRAAVAELEVTTRKLQARNEAVERAGDAHDRLTRIVVGGGGVDDVVRSVAEVLGARVVLRDLSGETIATSAPDEPVSDYEDAVIRRSLDLSRTAGSGDIYATPVLAGAEQLGSMLLGPREAERETHGDLEEGDQRILERAALVTALLLLFRRSVAEAEGRVRGELLDELLSGSAPDSETLRERGRLLQADLSRSYAVVVADVPGDRARVGQAATFLAATHDGFAAVRQGQVVLIFPGCEARAAGELAVEGLRLSAGAPVTVGAAGPVPGPLSSPDAVVKGYDEARRCLAAAVTLGRQGQVVTADDLGFVGLLLGTDGDPAAYVSSRLGPVVDYDEAKGSKLVETLRTYFGADRNLTRTAAALHVHVNTVTQRLERVTRLLGKGWQEPERQLEVQLALRLHQLVA